MLNKLLVKIRSMQFAWNEFWFADAAPQTLGLLRILTGTMLVYTHFVWGLKFQDFLGADGFNSAVLLKEIQVGTSPTAFLSFWWIVPEAYAWGVHLACLGILTLFTLGFMTRLTSIFSLVITISYAHRTMLANFGLDQINSVLIFYLTLSRCGDAYSLDRIWNRYRQANKALKQGGIPVIPEASPHWTNNLATRLLQFHYCVIYFAAGTSKLQGESWWAGEAILRAVSNYEYQSADLTWLAHVPWLVNLLTHATILWEISFCFLVWNPVLRPFILLCGIGMHLGIGAFLGMWTFGLAMTFGYLGFVPPGVVRRILRPLVSVLATRSQTIRLPLEQLSRRRGEAWKLAFDFLNRVTVQWEEKISPNSKSISPEEEASPVSSFVRSQSDIGPLVILCTQDSSAAYGRLIDYLSKYGFTCAVTRSVGEARDLTAFLQTRTCVLWFENNISSLHELIGNFASDWQHEMIPMIVRVNLPESEIYTASQGFPRQVRLLSVESTFRRLRQVLGELLEMEEARGEMGEQRQVQSPDNPDVPFTVADGPP